MVDIGVIKTISLPFLLPFWFDFFRFIGWNTGWVRHISSPLTHIIHYFLQTAVIVPQGKRAISLSDQIDFVFPFTMHYSPLTIFKQKNAIPTGTTLITPRYHPASQSSNKPGQLGPR
jgi:hypothetical protein